MQQINYVLVGFGGIAENRIAKEGFALDVERFTPLDGIKLIGATDINPARREAAEALGLKWYDSLEAVLADQSVQAVFIATNNSSHAAIAKQAIAAGKHCLIEKPLATTLEDAAVVKKLAQEQGVCVSVDHMMVCNAYNIKARELIIDGSLGEVNDMVLHMEFLYGSTPEEAASWRCSQPSELGGPIGDVASHCFYMAEFLGNSKITSMSCSYQAPKLDIKVENGAQIKFTLENGLTGTILVSFAEPRGGLVGTLSNLGYEIYGSKAICRSYGTMFQLSGYDDEPIKIRLDIDNGKSVEHISIANPDNIYQGVIIEHAEAIRQGKPGSVGDGYRNLELIMEAHRLAKE
ncbi:MAG: Gfo/Idh/MocA family oxidoreductase [Victivallaceae bacterium]|nr:Gfo/Idh/MocA family oxidoreductase [Victivallaceae bacterium]